MRLFILLLKPTALEVVIYTFASLFILFVASFQTILDGLVGEGVQREEIRSVGSVYSSEVNNFLSILDNQEQSATIITLLFWSAAGALIYIGIWAFSNGFVEFYHNTEIGDEYVKGRGVASKTKFENRTSKLIFRIVSVVLSLVYLILFLALLVPLWLELFRVGVGVLDQFVGWGMLSLSVIGAVLSIHVFTILLRLLTMKLRVHGSDADLFIEKKPTKR